jgi:hypothetical protein
MFINSLIQCRYNLHKKWWNSYFRPSETKNWSQNSLPLVQCSFHYTTDIHYLVCKFLLFGFNLEWLWKTSSRMQFKREGRPLERAIMKSFFTLGHVMSAQWGALDGQASVFIISQWHTEITPNCSLFKE